MKTQQQIEKKIARKLADTMSRAIDRPLREFSDMVQEELVGHCQEALTEATQPLLERVKELENQIKIMNTKELDMQELQAAYGLLNAEIMAQNTKVLQLENTIIQAGEKEQQLQSQLTTLEAELSVVTNDRNGVKLINEQHRQTIATLEAACAEQRLAIIQVISEVKADDILCEDGFTFSYQRGSAVHKQLVDAISSTSGQRILEENRKLNENFDALKKHYIKTIHAIRLTFGTDYGHAMDCDCDRCFDLLAADRFIQSLSTNQLNQGE